VFWFSGLRTALENLATQAQVIQMAYNSSQQELEELQAAPLRCARVLKKTRPRTEVPW
jgi:hypothetical protein